MGEAPKALQCYQNAVSYADADDSSYELLMSICGQMAELYHSQHLSTSELDVQEKVLRDFVLVEEKR